MQQFKFNLTTLILFLFHLSLSAQSSPCQVGDCSAAVFSINLNQNAMGAERNTQFQQAYLTFQLIKQSYQQQAGWQSNYDDFALGGKNCLRFYQLESAFGVEYLRNTDFKKFVEQQNGRAYAVVEDGFKSSRRGANLMARMTNKCPSEVRKLKKNTDFSLNQLPEEYGALGRELGYFDQDGNLLKPLDDPQESDKDMQQQLAVLQQQLTNLPIGQQATAKLNDLATKYNNAQSKVSKLKNALTTLKPLIDKFLPTPLRVLTDLGGIKETLENLLGRELKLPAIDKIKSLFQRGKKLTDAAQQVADRAKGLQQEWQDVNQRIADVERELATRTGNTSKLKTKLAELQQKKDELLQRLKEKGKVVTDDVTDLTTKAKDFQQQLTEETAVQDKLLDELDNLANRKTALESQLQQLRSELQDLESQRDQLQQETNAVESEAAIPNEPATPAAEVQQEETRIQTEFGQEMALDPVSKTEWTEDFSVEREYWNAVFHPDDEVVEGYRGRYFQVQLKDARKQVKLLFGPGEYFIEKSDFRDQYGSVIIAFVTEALAALKKTDREKIQLFVQGSADAAGQSTFRGELDSRFDYREIKVLPKRTNSDSFAANPKSLSVAPFSFTNRDLPNLRGNYLSEMISVYSKKLQPQLLEGSVKDKVDEGDRNAVIYLFIPENF